MRLLQFRLRVAPAACALLLLLSCVADGFAEVCPTTYMTCGASTVSNVATADSRVCPQVEPNYGTGSAAFDHAVGRFELAFDLEYAKLDATDRFTIEGLPIGTPLALTAAVDAVGSACGGDVATIRVDLFHAASSSGELFFGPFPGSGQPCPNPETRTLEVPVPVVVGTPFDVRVEIRAGSTGRGQATALLRFTGLPPGTRIRSCKGYSFDVPVPTMNTSWGSVKSSYR